MRLPRRRYKLTILYKSGVLVRAKAAEFRISGATYTWRNMTPDPLKLGPDDIAAVYRGWIR